MSGKKLKKSVLLPVGLALYATAMSCYFGPRLIAEGQSVKFWVSVAVEVIFIVVLFLALRRKDKLKNQWPDN